MAGAPASLHHLRYRLGDIGGSIGIMEKKLETTMLYRDYRINIGGVMVHGLKLHRVWDLGCYCSGASYGCVLAGYPEPERPSYTGTEKTPDNHPEKSLACRFS